jgi:hypothetical protein
MGEQYTLPGIDPTGYVDRIRDAADDDDWPEVFGVLSEMLADLADQSSDLAYVAAVRRTANELQLLRWEASEGAAHASGLRRPDRQRGRTEE